VNKSLLNVVLHDQPFEQNAISAGGLFEIGSANFTSVKPVKHAPKKPK